MSSWPIHDWLPLVFLGLMGLSALVYVVLDGFDLGVGLLSVSASDEERSTMIASIGPFWDANETWLVLAVGLLLVAFPSAHGYILGELYLPVALMLVGLTLRGVAFEFRAKGPQTQRKSWDRVFFAGSAVAALCQGYMLGAYVIGFRDGTAALLFSVLVAVCLALAYALLGACWLLAKTDGHLQKRSARQARTLVLGLVLGLAALSIATPLTDARVFQAWFRFPAIIALAPIPLATAALCATLYWLLARLPDADDRFRWLPFGMSIAVLLLAFVGLAYSFFPYVVPGQVTLWEAAASRESLAIILVGTSITLPMIIGYSLFAYRVFGGKATALNY